MHKHMHLFNCVLYTHTHIYIYIFISAIHFLQENFFNIRIVLLTFCFSTLYWLNLMKWYKCINLKINKQYDYINYYAINKSNTNSSNDEKKTDLVLIRL